MRTSPRPRHALRSALLSLVLVTGALSVATLSLSAPAAQAADLTIDQCNNVGPGPGGATTGMTCAVTVVNTISGSTTSSTTTLTRSCSLDPCPSGNGTFTSSSSSLVTLVNQCNGSGNDAAHPIGCTVDIINNISSALPGAAPVGAATVNQCVGSAGGGGGSLLCSPFPATTTNATVTQCNGSANGGGGTAACAVGSPSTVSPAIPVRVNQCNGTGNPGGTVLTCRTTIKTNLTAAALPPTPSATTSARASASPTPAAGSPAPSSTPAPGASPATTATPIATTSPIPGSGGPPQVTRIPTGGVQTGGGSTAGLQHNGLLALGGSLLLVGLLGMRTRRRTADVTPRRCG